MVLERPDLVRRYLRMQALAALQAGGRLFVGGPAASWPFASGCRVMVCWTGARDPLPTLDALPGRRRAVILGGVIGSSNSQVDSFADINWAAAPAGVYHLAVVSFGPLGVPDPINPYEVQTRIVSGGGLLGLLPNAPAALSGRLLPGNLPYLRWTLSRYNEAVAPLWFRIYTANEGGSLSFGSPHASVAFRAGQANYSWTGAALSAGVVRYYTVRAESASGVLSLIPQRRSGLSADYGALDNSRAVRIEVPAAGPTDLGTLHLEVGR